MFCNPWHTILRVLVHDKMSTAPTPHFFINPLDSFLSDGNNLTSSACNYLKFATLSLDIYIYKMLGADFLISCSRLHKWPTSAFPRPICPDLVNPSQISHVRWRWWDVDVPYLRIPEIQKPGNLETTEYVVCTTYAESWTVSTILKISRCSYGRWRD